MPKYKIETPDGRKVTIEAADEATAIRGAQEWSAANPPQRQGSDPTAALRSMQANQQRFDALPRRPGAPRVKPTRGQSRRPDQEAAGAMSVINSGIPLFDEMAAGFGMIGDLATGRSQVDLEAAGRQVLRQPGNPLSALAGLAPAYGQALGNQRALEEDFQTRRPVAANALRSSATAGSSLIPVTGATNAIVNGSRIGNVGRGIVVGGTQGAIYGAADRGDMEERLGAARDGAVIGGATGGAINSLGRARARPAPRQKPAGRPSDAQRLREAGVQLTPGQANGGAAKLMEDIGARLPIVGGAIRGARARGGESFNRAVANRALEPLGETVPADVPNGPESIAYVSRRLGKAFEDAYALVPRVQLDDEFTATAQAAAARNGELTPDNQRVLSGIVQQRLERLRGPVTGSDAGRIRSELGQVATRYLKSGDPNQQALGSVVRDIGNAIDDLITRADPTGQAGQALTQAREGWGAFAVLRRAGAGANTGTFTPGQLGSAVRANDSSVAKGAVARGEARLQDLSSAAARTMPDSFGNPGTSDVGAWLGLGGLAAANPVAGATTVAGLTAAATPYYMMARNIAKQVPQGASRQQAAAALRQMDEIIASSPEIASALAAERAALARLAGAGASTTMSPRPAPRVR